MSSIEEKEGAMRVLKVTMARGRTPEQNEALIAQLSQAAAEHLDWPLEEVRVAIYQVGDHEWGIGGRSVAARREPPNDEGKTHEPRKQAVSEGQDK